MTASLALLSILGATLVGAASPGPSFVLVSQIAVKSSRLDGVAAAVGMGLGGAIFATLALFGLVTVLLQIEWLYIALRILGGGYLVYLGICIWRGASRPLEVDDGGHTRPSSSLRSFLVGFVTQISNPKTAIVYASIFAAFLPASAPGWMIVALPALIFLVETSWYAGVALVFSAHTPREIYVCTKRWFDRVAGALMGALGARLISETLLSRN
ncbi:MAG: putative threonine efflux protein [Halomonas sp. HL-93]|nr:MAG: putative threonine efflux protein [Halomonas sp. HL-93]